MEEIQGSVPSESVVSLQGTRKEAPSLRQILKEEAELRGFIRYVARYDLRVQALEILEKKLYLSN
jgi:hypothetical protein